MKIKGIPIWEQYLEYIVLGAAVLVFLGFTAMQFIGNPNAVKDSRGETIAPSQVDDILEKEAKRLQPLLDPDAPGPEIPNPKPVADKFAARLAEGVSPDPRLDMPQRSMLVMRGVANLPTDVSFVEPKIPAPYDVVAAQYFDALPPDVVQEYDELAQMLPAAPYDMSWITAAATFDVAAVLAEYQRSGPDGEPAPVPPSWYGGKVTIVDVVMQRQELVDGHWTDLTSVQAIPGQFTIRSDIESGQMTGPDRDNLVQQFAQSPLMMQIIEPEFYTTRNASWSPPTEQITEEQFDRSMTDEEREILGVQARLNQLRKELARVEQALKDAGGELRDEGNRPKAPTGGDTRDAGGGTHKPPGPGGGGGAFGGSQKQRRDPTGAADQKRNEATRRTLTKKLDKLNQDIAADESRLAELGAQVQTEQPDGADETDANIVRIWAHDLDVDSGHTYRYRFIVRVLNPYFKHDVHLIDSQKQLASSIYIASDTSEWSQPMTAKPPLETFVVSANPPMVNSLGGGATQQPGKLGLGQTSFEVYRFFDGRWWKEKFAVEPGERVGERKNIRTADNTNVDIDFGTDWFVMDIVADLDPGESAERGRAASVLLQSITRPNMKVWRHPGDDATSFRRSELEDEVKQAENIASAQASAGGETTAN